MKTYKIVFIILIILFLLSGIILFSFFKFSKSEEQNICKKGGGNWKQFGNGCADSCSSNKDILFCTQALTNGCDCGENKCWDNSNKSCIFIK